MGTRHLICVFSQGQYRIAQYGQWDGYPSGQGIEILSFLRSMDKARFADKCNAAVFVDFSAMPEANAEALWNDNPHMSRDTGSDILQIVNDSALGIQLKNSIEFANDSLFCEWAYVIDLDANAFEVYEGFNHGPAAGRFTGPVKDGYGPVKLFKTYSLDAIPTDEAFLADLEPVEE